MAYDHNLRQKRNAQKAAEEVFEGKSHRDERNQLQHASKTTWLVTLGVLVAMGVVYSVINHFGTKGIKGSERSQTVEAQSSSSLESVEMVQTSQLSEQQASLDEQASVSSVESLPETYQRQGAAPVKEDLKQPKVLQPERHFEGVPDNTHIEGGDSSLTMDSLPIPEEAKRQPKMTFYEEMRSLEVPLDDPEKYPLMLKVPHYIVAGSFYRESSARRELKRLSAHGQQLTLVASSGKGDRVVYVLKTKVYKNRRELGARKNQLRDLGARVRSYPQRD